MVKKGERELARLAKQYGCDVRLTAGNHLCVVKNGKRVMYVSSTPSDRRAKQNVEAMMKRMFGKETKK